MTIDEIKRQMFIDSEEVCGNTMIDTYQAQEYVEQAYNKALDDIVTIIKERVGMDWEWDFCFIEQIADWLEELKALRLLLDWAIECNIGLDSFPEEYEKYKHTLTEDMTYKDMIIQIAKCVVAEEIKEQNR